MLCDFQSVSIVIINIILRLAIQKETWCGFVLRDDDSTGRWNVINASWMDHYAME